MTTPSPQQPNIVLIVIDEIRYPRELPDGITSADQFIQNFMPNLNRLWTTGVKFGNHFTTAPPAVPPAPASTRGCIPCSSGC